MKLPNPYELEKANVTGTRDIARLDVSNVWKGSEMFLKNALTGVKDAAVLSDKFDDVSKARATSELLMEAEDQYSKLGPANWKGDSNGD